MQVKYNMVVDFARPNKSNTILIAEDDANSRNCLFTLLADKQPFDMTGVTTATILGITSTGARIYADAEIIKDEEGNNTNVISYLFPAALTDTAGNITFTVTLADNVGARITSFEFFIKIRNALYNEDDFIDEDDMAGFRDLLARTRAALERMEQMVQQDALPNPYPLRITVDNVTYEYTGADLVDVLLGEIAYLGPVAGTVDITADDSAAAIAVAAAQDAEQALADTQILIGDFQSQIPTATVTKNLSTHQSIIVITDKNGTTTATVDDGVVGSSWYSGTDITGTGTNITGAEGIEGDWYLNETTSQVYNCVSTGDASTALWDYVLTMGTNNFGRVKVGTTVLNANGSDILEFKNGDNVTLVPNTVDNSITIHSAGGGGGGGTSTGDMLKSVYDSNNDGVVNSADTLLGLTASVAELNYTDGVTSNIQDQLDGKADSIHTHTSSQITDLDIPVYLSDLLDDSSHRFVSDTEKSTWNNKQNALTAGTGISISGNTISATATQSKGYKTVKVGSTDVDAGSAEDTIEFVADGALTITPDPINKKLTFYATGGGGGTSTGDMLKSVYDHNNDGVVNSADTLAGLTASIAELNYTDGVTSNIQDQIDGKADSIHTHTKSQITDLSIPTALAQLTADATHRVVTDTQIAAWSNKQNALSAGTGIQIEGNTISAPGGTTALSGLTTDVDITPSSLTGNELLKYDLTAAKWKPSPYPSIPTISDSYSSSSHDGMSGVAVASAVSAGVAGKADESDLDGWTSSVQTLDGTTVIFSGLNDAYGYDLYCEDKLIGISNVVKSGSGTSTTLTYTVTGAQINDSFKLRILK